VPADTLIARTDVTRQINQYVIKHQLKDKVNGRIIHADATLQVLLKLGAGEELTYFNLQKHLSHHFPKQQAGDADTVAATA
jgi:chromatin remodeling complex protein RSC6